MDDSFGPGGFDLSQTGTVGGVPSENKAEGICPILIGQLLNQGGNDFSLFGMPFAMVSVVAIVTDIDHSSTKIKYTLEDHTGQLEAHYWLEGEGEGDTNDVPQVLIKTYVKAYGSVRDSSGTKVIMLFRIEPTNINELTTHLLEVLNARYMAEEYSKSGYKPEGVTNGLGRATTSFNMTSDSNGHENNGAAAGLKGKNLLIFDAVKNFTGDAGMSLTDLQQKFSHIPPAEMLTITEFLSSEGHIYSSIDSEHFLATDPA